MSTKLPTDAKERKATPLYSGLVKYFPDALAAVAQLSQIANEQHNPGTPVHWDRSKSTDELDCLLRHLFEAGTIDSDGVRHSTKVAWRALANLQKELEAAQTEETPHEAHERLLAQQTAPRGPVVPERTREEWITQFRGELCDRGLFATAARLAELL